MTTDNYRTPSEVLSAINDLDTSSAFQNLYIPTLLAEIEEVRHRILTFEITEKYTLQRLQEDRAIYKTLMKQSAWMKDQRELLNQKTR